MRIRREVKNENLRKFEMCLKRNERDLRFSEEKSNGDGMKIAWTSFICPECRIRFENTIRLLDHIMPCQFSRTVAERYRLLGSIDDDVQKVIDKAVQTRLKSSILEQSFTDIPNLILTVPMSSELAAYFQNGLEIYSKGDFQEYVEFRTKIDGKWYDLRFLEKYERNQQGTSTSNRPINGSELVEDLIILSSDEEPKPPKIWSAQVERDSSPLVTSRRHQRVVDSSDSEEKEDDRDEEYPPIMPSESDEDIRRRRRRGIPPASRSFNAFRFGRVNWSESGEEWEEERKEPRYSARRPATPRSAIQPKRRIKQLSSSEETDTDERELQFSARQRRATLRRSQRISSSESEEKEEFDNNRRELRSSVRKPSTPRKATLRGNDRKSSSESEEKEESDDNRRELRSSARRPPTPRKATLRGNQRISSSESDEKEESDDNRRELRSSARRPPTPRKATLRGNHRISSSESDEKEESDGNRRELRSSARRSATPRSANLQKRRNMPRSLARKTASPKNSIIRRGVSRTPSESEEEPEEDDRRGVRTRRRSTPIGAQRRKRSGLRGAGSLNQEERDDEVMGNGNVSSDDESPKKRRKIKVIKGNFDDLLKQCENYELVVPDIITFTKSRDTRHTNDLAQALGLPKAAHYTQIEINRAMRRKFNKPCSGTEVSDEDDHEVPQRRDLRRSGRVERAPKSTRRTRRNSNV